MSAVDVLAVMASLASFGGTIEPRSVRSEMNVPRGTGLIANRARWLNGLHTREPTTPQVAAALRKAEKAGIVARCGTGAEHCRAWNKSASQEKEIYWRITDTALARCKGEGA